MLALERCGYLFFRLEWLDSASVVCSPVNAVHYTEDMDLVGGDVEIVKDHWLNLFLIISSLPQFSWW